METIVTIKHVETASSPAARKLVQVVEIHAHSGVLRGMIVPKVHVQSVFFARANLDRRVHLQHSRMQLHKFLAQIMTIIGIRGYIRANRIFIQERQYLWT